MNKAMKKYIKDLKVLLPMHGKREKQIFSGVSLRLQELVEMNPNLTYQEMCDELGEPKDIVSEYFENADMLYLSKRFRTSYYLRNVFICFVVFLLCLVGLYNAYLQEALEESKKSQINYEIENIQ